jgi:hypothetical protein
MSFNDMICQIFRTFEQVRNAAKDRMFRLMVRNINDYAYQDIDSLLYPEMTPPPPLP